ncbi:MAG TPA: NINE protein [Saprospiraceae bacterium]|nr:NINE protein [Saprospiraceae bacterium]HMQ82452.1 NINE protein [Saprospiraceae bacterium]
MKKKSVAGILALFMGIFGVHRFYLGQRFLGVVYFLLTCFLFVISFEEHMPAILPMGILGFIDAILFLAMPKEDFDARYNKGFYDRSPSLGQSRSQRSTPSVNRRIPVEDPVQILKASGIKHYREFCFEEAIEDFERALAYAPNDISLHFNLACAFSMIEMADESFEHLEKAVALGFNQFQKIQQHSDLSYLRAQREFAAFEINGYRKPVAAKPLPQPSPNMLDTQAPAVVAATPAEEEKLTLLDRIELLGDLLDKGILTQEEFALQKERLLNQ